MISNQARRKVQRQSLQLLYNQTEPPDPSIRRHNAHRDSYFGPRLSSKQSHQRKVQGKTKKKKKKETGSQATDRERNRHTRKLIHQMTNSSRCVTARGHVPAYGAFPKSPAASMLAPTSPTYGAGFARVSDETTAPRRTWAC